MLKRFFCLSIVFSMIYISSPSSFAMRNITGEVWDYDNVTHTGTYSCPESETDVFATYGYPAVLTAVGWAGAWAYTKGADYFWERTPEYLRNTVWPRVRNGAAYIGNNATAAAVYVRDNTVEAAGNARRAIGQRANNVRERFNAWRMRGQMQQ